jgi:four helix bundle protein
MSTGFKDLRVWQRAHRLANEIVRSTDSFPAGELYALVPQMRRSARSVSHNIAEGASRRTVAEFMHFLYIARGSLAELEDQLLFAIERGYICDVREMNEELEAVRRMLNNLISALTTSPANRRKRGS